MLTQRSVLARGAVRRVAALAVVFALTLPVGLTPSTAAAFVAPADEATQLDEAKTLYDEGVAYFETHDYEAAVEKWTLAYAKLPDNATGQRNAMVYNIATAQEKAYGIDHDLQHLRQAQLLLESYVKTYKAMYKKTDESKAEVDKANARIQALRDRIAAAEQGQAPTPASAGTNGGITWSSGQPPAVDPAQLEHDRLLTERKRKNRQMLIASYVLLPLGGLIVLGGAAIIGTRESQDSNNTSFSGVGTLAFGVATVGVGAALLGVGLTRKKKLARGELVFAPAWAPAFAGASLRGRF